VAIFIGPKWGNETVNFVAVANVAEGTISVSPLPKVYAEGNTVVAVVPRNLIKPTTRLMTDFPQPTWRYYVLVTSYDRSGPAGGCSQTPVHPTPLVAANLDKLHLEPCRLHLRLHHHREGI
jgi:hypothetical protein